MTKTLPWWLGGGGRGKDDRKQNVLALLVGSARVHLYKIWCTVMQVHLKLSKYQAPWAKIRRRPTSFAVVNIGSPVCLLKIAQASTLTHTQRSRPKREGR
jgi:hypothetical protein